MDISTYHIQNVIRAYGRRSGRIKGVRRRGLNSKSPQRDVITISAEAKKRQITEKVSVEIMNRLKEQSYPIPQALSEKMPGELGDLNLQIIKDDKEKGSLRFRIIDENQNETLKEISYQQLESIMAQGPLLKDDKGNNPGIRD